MNPTRFRLRLLVLLCAASALLLPGLAQVLTADGADDEPAPVLLPPVGVTVMVTPTTMDVTWVRGPGTTAPVAGYYVFVQETNAPGFQFRDYKVTETTAHIEGLRPDTDYTVMITAGTTTLIDGQQRRGVWFISRFSAEETVHTPADYTLQLVGGNRSSGVALFRITRHGISAVFRATIDETVGRTISLNGKEARFNTPWKLASLRLVQRRRELATPATPLLQPDGTPYTDADGTPYSFPMPSYGPVELMLEATLTAPPPRNGADPRQMVLLQQTP
ncbi:MAG: fibronectin type III domain-containing protein [Planctomycetota bacterium]